MLLKALTSTQAPIVVITSNWQMLHLCLPSLTGAPELSQRLSYMHDGLFKTFPWMVCHDIRLIAGHSVTTGWSSRDLL